MDLDLLAADGGLSTFVLGARICETGVFGSCVGLSGDRDGPAPAFSRGEDATGEVVPAPAAAMAAAVTPGTEAAASEGFLPNPAGLLGDLMRERAPTSAAVAADAAAAATAGLSYASAALPILMLR